MPQRVSRGVRQYGIHMRHVPILLLLLLMLPLACTRKQEPAELYQVASHEASSGEWVIIHVNNEEHNRVQIRVVCDFYKLGDNKPVEGPDSCDLIVGQTLVPNRLRTRPGEFLDIWQLGDKLFIARGEGVDRVHQQFSIRSAKVMQ